MRALKSVRNKTKWAIDYDYLSKLSDEDLLFLQDFNNFFYHGSPNRCELLSLDDDLKKESYSLNNSRERDIFTKFNRVFYK